MTRKHFQSLADALKEHKAQIDAATYRRLVKDVALTATGTTERASTPNPSAQRIADLIDFADLLAQPA